jgi:predicted nucleotidyltransferase component of viral defense system
VSQKNVTNMAASVHQRLLNVARTTQRPFHEILQYYAIERFLYRLAQSRYGTQFVLKGALTLRLWYGVTSRPTRDIDLLGRMQNDPEFISQVIRELCQLGDMEDGLVFAPASVCTMPIVEAAEYEGVRVSFHGHLGKARVAMQLDIGFGDIVTPAPVAVIFPVILPLPAPHLQAYNRETVIAEKLQAMVTLGELNTRMKDFYDVWLLANSYGFNGPLLVQAITATFRHRETRMDVEPLCFQSIFTANPVKATQWTAFVRNSRLAGVPEGLPDLMGQVRSFLQPVLRACALAQPFPWQWSPSGPWRTP